jgi:ABC-type uncharacterized transport system involved in gliding motility auxiliary subunit
MGTGRQPKPTFSPYRRWAIGFHVFVLALVVLAVVVMVNYINQDYFLRFHTSTRTRIELSPRTLGLLRSLNRPVKVILYYDTKDEQSLYSIVSDLLKEYQNASPKITVQVVDYIRDPGLAQKVKAQYNKLSAPTDKNLVIFDCEGKVKIVPGDGLASYVVEPTDNPEVGGKGPRLERRPAAFLGEMAFTAALLDVTSSQPLKAYFLEGHYEQQIDSADEIMGYLKFALILQQNCITAQTLSLLGTNTVPADCNLLVIAGPRNPISDAELEKIDRYLSQGGRLLALFNFASVGKELGLERLLARWGVDVGHNVVTDRDNAIPGKETDIFVHNFGDGKHPVVNSLLGSGLHLSLPRTIARLKPQAEAADAPRVDEITFTGPNATGSRTRKPPLPLMVAVEKGAIKDVITERGATRIVVVGDSFFLGNTQIDSAANRDFVNNAVNWLVERPQLLAGLGPRPITQYRIVMTNAQMHRAQWILLGGLPGSVLLLGALVWLKRRR